MSRYAGIILFHVYTAFLMLVSQAAFPQSGEVTAASPDSTKSDVAAPKHTLFAAGGYGSNMIYLGSTISQDQPYGYAALSYGFKNSLYLTASAIHLENHNPYVAFYTGSLGYSRTFNSWFDISLSTTRYQVDPSLRETLFSSFFYSDLTLGIDWRILYSKLSAGWLHTSENGMYYQFRNSRYISTPSFFRKKAFISFDPYVNILFGTLSTVETSTDTITTITYPFYTGTTGTGNGNGNGSGSGSGTGTGSTTGSTTTTTTVTNSTLSTTFGIMEIDFGLPISFTAGKLTIEAEPGYVIPMYDESFFPGTKGFLFTVSCYIKIF